MTNCRRSFDRCDCGELEALENAAEVRAEVERLKAELAEAKALHDDALRQVLLHAKAATAVEAELNAERERHHATAVELAGRVERLTAALTRVKHGIEDSGWNGPSWAQDWLDEQLKETSWTTPRP